MGDVYVCVVCGWYLFIMCLCVSVVSECVLRVCGVCVCVCVCAVSLYVWFVYVGGVGLLFKMCVWVGCCVCVVCCVVCLCACGCLCM